LTKIRIKLFLKFHQFLVWTDTFNFLSDVIAIAVWWSITFIGLLFSSSVSRDNKWLNASLSMENMLL
jgi:hypothetical protein